MSIESVWSALEAGDWSRATLSALHDLLAEDGSDEPMRLAVAYVLDNRVPAPRLLTGRLLSGKYDLYYWRNEDFPDPTVAPSAETSHVCAIVEAVERCGLDDNYCGSPTYRFALRRLTVVMGFQPS